MTTQNKILSLKLLLHIAKSGQFSRKKMRQGLIIEASATLNFWSIYLSLPNTGITGVQHHRYQIVTIKERK